MLRVIQGRSMEQMLQFLPRSSLARLKHAQRAPRQKLKAQREGGCRARYVAGPWAVEGYSREVYGADAAILAAFFFGSP